MKFEPFLDRFPIARSLASAPVEPTGGVPATLEPAHDFPAVGAPNFHGLVSADWLARLLGFNRSHGGASWPRTVAVAQCVVLEAGWGMLDRARNYLAGHVPGAIHLDTDELETPYPEWRLREPADLQRVLGRAGIAADSTVIVYGQPLIAAARVWWVLRYAGVADVRLLDGGFAAWVRAGHPVERELNELPARLFSGAAHPELLATTQYLREHMSDPHVRLADVRSTAEFAGQSSGYSFLDARGRIPAAIHLGDADDSARLYMRDDGRLHPPDAILAEWRARGFLPSCPGAAADRETVFYCGTGWRSSLAFFYAWLMGIGNIRNYSDGWSGWSTNYTADAAARGGTPGWRQQATGNPFR